MQARILLLVAVAAVLILESSARTVDLEAQFGNGETERIIAGEAATEGMFPWMTVLLFNGQFICSSSIISPRTILTAAHCVVFNGVTESPSSFRALANYRMSADEVRIDIASITPHPNYTDSNGIQNDIAILTTTEDIPFSDTVKPICIARKDTDPMAYKNATAMGWGNTNRNRLEKPDIPDELQYVEQKVVSNAVCRFSYFFMEIESSKICAGGFLNGICNGDSGGPLVHLSANQEPVEIGVASYINAIFGCGSITKGVWTRVSSYNDFIMENAVDAPSICEV